MRRLWNGFTYNKDAGMMVCPAGHMAKNKQVTKRHEEKWKNDRIRFIFDREKCAVCKYAEKCGFKGGRRGKQYTISLLTKEQEMQLKRARNARVQERIWNTLYRRGQKLGVEAFLPSG